jgi:signal transduction histidine kinase/CheY-like chemotaxis protein
LFLLDLKSASILVSMSLSILTTQLSFEHDVVLVRQRARQVAKLLGFEAQDQTRIATAVSEIARNALNYGGGGKIEFELSGKTPPQLMVIRISDRGRGIPNLQEILDGRYQSRTGMGLGIRGARRLMDQFKIESEPGAGTMVLLKKLLPATADLVSQQRLSEISTELARLRPQDPLGEIQQQNQELLSTLDELRKRQEDLSLLNDELEDTNRGVVALYAELDEKADHLRRADELKSRFLSNMTHEFRTPVNSIIALSHILLARMDGDLTSEQEKQVRFISSAAEDLSTLVNDLLDLAKVEAGKIEVHASDVTVGNLFGALRGMLKPLLVSDRVSLVFDEPEELPVLSTDEGKVSQILRNFISNALKFTESGEIRVSAQLNAAGDAAVFSVTDTGIGIPVDQQEFIFQEFTQVPNPLQKNVKGTGLGLPLTRRLAGLLGGVVGVESAPGKGSKFYAVIPISYAVPVAAAATVDPTWELDPELTPVLVVEDSAEMRMVYEKYLKGTGFQMVPASTVKQAQQALHRHRPQVIVLDLQLKGEDTWGFLARLKKDDETRAVPVMIVSQIEDQAKAIGLGADVYGLKPIQRRWLLDNLNRLTRGEGEKRILLIDDEEATRYWLKGLLASTGASILETPHGLEGIRMARELQPQVILLDLVMAVMQGEDVLDQLKADPSTESIPVIIVTSKNLQPQERASLNEKAVAVLSKTVLSRPEGLPLLREALQQARWDVFLQTARD